ncbi:hypothetical protein CIG21_09420 [Corynebacterium hadale]|uniref:Uncharacterized protein n=1 Tax=Corynebacterium hadale TaxID=2026255 RepID=A0A269PC13_9CORY|nr:hypothetical protein CIG21_09420 [Corynebacterium hadale]
MQILVWYADGVHRLFRGALAQHQLDRWEWTRWVKGSEQPGGFLLLQTLHDVGGQEDRGKR